jgi:hypothetical protein
MPDLRDAGVAAVVAAAGGLALGLVKLGASGWLARGVFAGLKGWQVLNAGAFAVNLASVSVPGRVDGEMAAEAQRAARAAKTAKTADTADTPAGIPRDHWSRGLFSPAGWAFAIWGVIFLGETVFTAAQALPDLDPNAAATYMAVSPWWAAACGLQALWCVAFRPWTRPPRRFWLSGALLAAESVALAGAHAKLRAAVHAIPLSAYLCCHLPLSLHFGWITAATVLSLNSFVAVAGASPRTKIATARASAWGSLAAGAAVTVTTGDPVYALTLAWALAAVAADGGKSARDAVDESRLATISRDAARAAKSLVAVAALVAFAEVF